ncbi:hypothetical protein [Loktanella salsilacus]|uniref:hypothetical protein n=1 Tax=Loktanella salsilacus TaxID=195913 RepID=UPI00373699C9
MKPLIFAAFCLTFAGAASLLQAEGEAAAVIDAPVQGSVSRTDGLEAFDRIYDVVSHPRCANCHTGPDNIPMWYGGKAGPARPHGMNINAGQSRIGVETLTCATCHTTSQDLGSDPHAPPRAGLDWQLAPVEFEWFAKTPAQICAQLSDPDRNGGRDWMGLAEHLVDDAGHRGFVLWGWNPGGEREPAPFTLQAHVNDILQWGASGMPCPQG